MYDRAERTSQTHASLINATAVGHFDSEVERGEPLNGMPVLAVGGDTLCSNIPHPGLEDGVEVALPDEPSIVQLPLLVRIREEYLYQIRSQLLSTHTHTRIPRQQNAPRTSAGNSERACKAPAD